MVFKKMKKEHIGEFMQCLYDCEINLRIEWSWDAGVEWQFGDKYNGFKEFSNFGKQVAFGLDPCCIETQFGLIVVEFFQHYKPITSEGKFNKVFTFLYENEYISKIHFYKGHMIPVEDINGNVSFEVFERRHENEPSAEGTFSTYDEAFAKVDALI